MAHGIAKFETKCLVCNHEIHPGDEIRWSPAIQGSQRHLACEAAAGPHKQNCKYPLFLNQDCPACQQIVEAKHAH